ncbi:MAG: membrane protein insertion efficiency factor YidD [Verrucomicrobiales bacterium]|nr:membrane protein insertion efficiency factor YidD [Verrucomicrobiales bacterium]
MKHIIKLLIRFYQILISPLIHLIGGPNSGCRFDPTCSEYFLQAVQSYGAFRGSILGIKRILRCGPWGGHGHDPVPLRFEQILRKEDNNKQDLLKHG